MAASAFARTQAPVLVLLLAAAGCSSPRAGNSSGFLPKELPAAPTSFGANRTKGRPADSGLSLVTIPNVASNTWMVSDGAGGEWMGNNNALVRVDEKTYGVSQYVLAGESQVIPFTPGPVDNAVWFSYSGSAGSGVGFIDRQIHRIKKYGFGSIDVIGMAPGPDNAMWLTYWNTADAKYRIGRLDLGTNKLLGFPSPGGRPVGFIIQGPDGALWFDDSSNPHPKIGRIDPHTHHISEYAISMGVVELRAGPDGAIWFSRNTLKDSIGRLDLTTHAVKYYSTAAAAGPLTSRDQDLWFTIWQHSTLTRRIEKVSASTGHSRKFVLPLKIFGLTRGGDDQLWANNQTTVVKICPDLDISACIGYRLR